MPSITSAIKRTPSSQQFFKGETGTQTVYYFPYQTSLSLATGTYPTGVQSVSGTNIYFDTYANVRAWIGNSGSATKTLILDTDFFRDMGKELNVYYYQQVAPSGTNVPIHAVTLSKAQKIITPGETTEGATGNAIGAATLQGYNTVHVATWSANPDVSTGIPIGVARTGFQ